MENTVIGTQKSPGGLSGFHPTGWVLTKMRTLARNANAQPLLMSSSWPMLSHKQMRLGTRMGLFHTRLYYDD